MDNNLQGNKFLEICFIFGLTRQDEISAGKQLSGNKDQITLMNSKIHVKQLEVR